MGAESYSIIPNIGPWTVQWEPPKSSADVAGRMHVRTGCGPFAEADGSKPGLHLVFSSSPASADFSPRYFNRARRLLEAEGKLCPPGDIPEVSRRLRDR
jgi:hypothetical protein